MNPFGQGFEQFSKGLYQLEVSVILNFKKITELEVYDPSEELMLKQSMMSVLQKIIKMYIDFNHSDGFLRVLKSGELFGGEKEQFKEEEGSQVSLQDQTDELNTELKRLCLNLISEAKCQKASQK